MFRSVRELLIGSMESCLEEGDWGGVGRWACCIVGLGRGGRERWRGAFFQGSFLIESWSASNSSTSGRDPVSNHHPLPFLGNISLFGSVQSHSPPAVIGPPLSNETDASAHLARNPRRSRLWSRCKGSLSSDPSPHPRTCSRVLSTWHSPRWRSR